MAATVDINDAVFCQNHLLEVCGDCDHDSREDNDAFYGFDAVDRAAITMPHVSQEDGVYKCSKHGIATCSQCFGWKKQISRLRVAAKRH